MKSSVRARGSGPVLAEAGAAGAAPSELVAVLAVLAVLEVLLAAVVPGLAEASLAVLLPAVLEELFKLSTLV